MNLAELPDLQDLQELASLSPIHVDGREQPFSAWICDAPLGWRRAAIKLSSLLPGQIWAWEHGLSWINGKQVVRIIESAFLCHVLAARECCYTLGVTPGGTVGGCCRAILEWIAEPMNHTTIPPEIQIDNWNYLEVRPGRYPAARLYDVSSCYWQLFQRLPSLRLSWQRDRLQWFPLSPEEAARRKDMEALLSRFKVIRNSMVGVMYGSYDPPVYYCQGERRLLQWEHMQPKCGPFPRAAMLIYRSAWELCRAASVEVDSVYSCVDCVVSAGTATKPPTRCETWRSVGLQSRMAHWGKTDICQPGVYRIGGKRTEPYRLGVRKRIRFPRPEALSREVYRLWL